VAKNYHPIWNLLGWRPTGDVGPFTLYTSSRKRIVIYPRSPALNPATPAQERMRQVFVAGAACWKSLTIAQRAEWELATKKLRMSINGYNFFMHTTYYEGTGYVVYARQRTGLTLFYPASAVT